MVLPSSTDVTLDIKDFLSEQEYDRKKAGIISRIVNSPIEVEYARDTNCAYELHDKSGVRKGFRVVKAKPKLKCIDGNTAMNHELAHVLFDSFDPRALQTLRDWAFQYGVLNSPSNTTAFQVYHTAMNVIEDQRIESLWGKIYLGNARDFVRVRKKLGKELSFMDHPSAVLLAERFDRPDMVKPSKYAHVAPFIHDVEGKDLSATMIVMKRIKPYLDEKIKDFADKDTKYRELYDKKKASMDSLYECTEPEQRARLQKQKDYDCEVLANHNAQTHNEKLPTTVETRRRPTTNMTDDNDDSVKYTDDELGGKGYEEALKSSEASANNKLQQIKQSMEGAEMIKVPEYIREKVIDKRSLTYVPKVDRKVVANFKGLLRTFKEKTHEAASDEGYDLDIGEYINMKANGYGDCFIEDRETNGLSIVLSIDGSGSMDSQNRMVSNMVATMEEATKGEKEIDIRTIVWSSDGQGNMALQRFGAGDIKYLPSQRGGYTPTHFGIEAGSKELARMNGRRKLLIVITDGYPNYHVNGVKVRTDSATSATIKSYKKALRMTPNIAVVGVGFASNGYMRNMFGNKYISCRSMNEVGHFMTTTLRREIVRVMKQ